MRATLYRYCNDWNFRITGSQYIRNCWHCWSSASLSFLQSMVFPPTCPTSDIVYKDLNLSIGTVTLFAFLSMVHAYHLQLLCPAVVGKTWVRPAWKIHKIKDYVREILEHETSSFSVSGIFTGRGCRNRTLWTKLHVVFISVVIKHFDDILL